MIDHINETMSKHIMTIEDPIEFVHDSRKSLVSQRELGSSTLSFATALRSAASSPTMAAGWTCPACAPRSGTRCTTRRCGPPCVPPDTDSD